MKRKLQKGETLVEAILALAVVAAITTGIVIAVITALSGTSFNQDSNYALNLAQEGSDLVRDQASNDFATFQNTNNANLVSSGYYCLGADDNALDADNSDGVTNYDNARMVCPDNTTNISTGNGEYLRVVYLQQSGCDSRKGSCSQVCAVGTGFVASIVSWSDPKCKTSTNCHKVEIDSCVTDLNKVQAP